MAHAPQFFTLPDSEDKETVEKVKRLAAANGKKLKALKPDIYVTISNDHANQFVLHCVPPFAIHRGKTGTGTFAGRKFEHPIASDEATETIRYLYEEGFDVSYTSTAEVEYSLGIPLNFLGVDGPIMPLFVNAYVPPQPRMERCYALGQAINRALKAQGLRAVVIASGGMSHFPGTERYSSPDLEFDRKVLAELETGNLRYLLALDEKRMDDTGNIELRCWGVATGMLGERKPDTVSPGPELAPQLRHTLAWWSQPKAKNRSNRTIPPSRRTGWISLSRCTGLRTTTPSARNSSPTRRPMRRRWIFQRRRERRCSRSTMPRWSSSASTFILHGPSADRAGTEEGPGLNRLPGNGRAVLYQSQQRHRPEAVNSQLIRFTRLSFILKLSPCLISV